NYSCSRVMFVRMLTALHQKLSARVTNYLTVSNLLTVPPLQYKVCNSVSTLFLRLFLPSVSFKSLMILMHFKYSFYVQERYTILFIGEHTLAQQHFGSIAGNEDKFNPFLLT